jgi:hypothetical protein
LLHGLSAADARHEVLSDLLPCEVGFCICPVLASAVGAGVTRTCAEH